MASKVNTKFILGLGTALVLAFGAVVYIAYESIKKSGDDYIKLGDQAMAESKYTDAIGLYGKAVFKDQRNGPWIRKWIEAMEKSTPKGRAAYGEAFGQYQKAMRALTEAEPSNVEVMRKWLDMQWELTRAEISQRNLESFIIGVNDSMKTFQGTEAEAKTLWRYRGLARVAIVQLKAEVKPEDLEQARKDLEGALAANPKDVDAALGLAGVDLALAERARGRDDKEKADEYVKAARARVEKFVTENPNAVAMSLALFSLDLQLAQQDNTTAVSVIELLQDRQAKLEELVAGVLASDPATLEAGTALQIAGFARAALPNPRNNEAADQIVAHILKGKPDDPGVLIRTADADAESGRVNDAIAKLQKVVDLPDQPLSLKGLMLNGLRTEAIRKQTDLSFRTWESAKDLAAKNEAAAQAKKFRDALVERAGDSNNIVLGIDARLSLINGDIKGALTQLTRYNQQVNEQDPRMMLLQGTLLERTGSVGAAKAAYERVLQLRDFASHRQAYLALSKLASDRGDFAEAHRMTSSALKYAPDDKDLKNQESMLRQLAEGRGDDPVVKLLAEVQQIVAGVDGNPQKALDRIREVMAADPKVAADFKAHRLLVQMLAGMNDREGAIAAIDAAAKQFTGNSEAKMLETWKAQLSQTDPVQAAMEQIDKADALPLNKFLAKYEIYTQASGDEATRTRYMELARSALAEAVKLAPDDPKVVDAQFDDALRRKDMPEITRLVGVAEAKNVDKVGGQFYRARMQYVDGKFLEAAQTLRNVVERDKLNFQAWRLLGGVQMQLNDANAAAEAFGKAVEIRPSDVTSLNGYLRALILSQRLSEALEHARKSERLAASNPEFADLYLRLETSAPGGNPQRALQARQSIAESKPDNMMNKADLALLQIDQRKWDDAKATIDSLRADEKFKDAVTELDARWFAMQGKFAEAEKVYDDAITARPKDRLDESIFISASNIFNGVGQPDRAVAMLKKGLPIQKKETMYIDRQMGDVLFQARRPMEAVEAYKRVLDAGSKDDDNAVAKRILEAYLLAKEYAKFDEMLVSLGDKAKNDATLLVLQAESALAQKNPEGARRLFDQAVAADQKNFVVFMKRGELFGQDPAKFRDAMADFEQAARLAPNSIMPRRRMAELSMMMGKPDQAVENLTKALQIDPTDDGVRNDLINLQMSLNHQDAVVDLVDQAIQVKPDKIEWRLRGGQLMMGLNRVDRAVDYLKPAWERRKEIAVAIPYVTALVSKTPADIKAASAVALDPALKEADPMAMHVLRGLVYQRNNQGPKCDQEMAQALTKLEQANPQRCELFMAGLETIFGDAKSQIDAFDRIAGKTELKGWMPIHREMLRLRLPDTAPAAATALDGIAETAPDASTKATIHQLLAAYYVQTSQFAKGVEYCDKVLEVDPNNMVALNNSAYIMAKHLKRPADALPKAEKALELSPGSPTALDTLGTVHLELKNCAKAEEYLKLAVEGAKADNDVIPAMLHLAQAQDCLNRKLDAQNLLERVRQRFEGNPELKMQFGEDLKQITQEIDGK